MALIETVGSRDNIALTGLWGVVLWYCGSCVGAAWLEGVVSCRPADVGGCDAAADAVISTSGDVESWSVWA